MSNIRDALEDMAKALAAVYKRQPISIRRKAWGILSASRNRSTMEDLLRNPNRPIKDFRKLSFREWLQHDC